MPAPFPRAVAFVQLAAMMLLTTAPAAVAEPPVIGGPGTATVAPTRARRSRAPDARRTQAVLEQLRVPVDSCQFEDTRFEDALQWFRARGVRNILVRWRAIERDGRITRDTPLDFQLDDMTLGELLDIVLEQVSQEAAAPDGTLTYHIHRGAVEITTRGDFADEMVTRVYDFAHIIQPVLGKESMCGEGYHGTARLDPARCSSGRCRGLRKMSGGYNLVGARGRKAKNAIDMLKALAPGTWVDDGGRGWITRHEDHLIVHTTLEVHEMIGGSVSTPRRVP